MKRFKKVYIETTNICNLDCSFCPKTCRPGAYMSVEDFKRVIEQVKPYTDYVYLHLMGEPLLNPHLDTFLKICHESDLKVNLTTNGTLLAEKGQTLLEGKALRQVNISLSSFEANVITKELEVYIKEVCEFILNAVKEKGIICSLRLWNMDTDSLKGENTFNEEILGLIEQHLQLEKTSLSKGLKEKLSFKIMNKLYLNMAEKFAWPDIEMSETNPSVFCYGLRDQIGILVDGTVVPCCLDSEGNIPLGNIFKEPLEAIINSTRAINLYEGFSNRKAVEELCQKCGYAIQKHSS